VQESRSYSSKVLLFGEYSVIKGSKALAIPYSHFSGKLELKRRGEQRQSSFYETELLAFSDYLNDLSQRGELPCSLDLEKFSYDLSCGLVFNSTIPVGHGLGSSGALCAAIFDRYVKEKITSIPALLSVLSKLESHFHGASSGLDPLVSLVDKSVIIETRDGAKVPYPCDFSLDALKEKEKPWSLFLLNTKRTRKTEPLVNLFLEMCRNEQYESRIIEELIPLTNSCIDDLVNNHFDKFYMRMFELSALQYSLFKSMIPPLYQQIWNDGLKSRSFALKLCGAGGGGFLMGISPMEQLKHPAFKGQALGILC